MNILVCLIISTGIIYSFYLLEKLISFICKKIKVDEVVFSFITALILNLAFLIHIITN